MSRDASVQGTATPLAGLVLAAAAISAIGMGLRQVAGLFMKPMAESLSIGREDFSIAIAVANIVWGLAAPVTGLVADRYGAGRVVVMGGLATAAGLAMMWAAEDRTDLLLAGVLSGLGVAGAGVNALVGTVGRASPPERRASAVAAVGIGAGIGMLAVLPYAHLLIEAIGARASLAVLSLSALAILPLAWPVSGRPADVPGATEEGAQDALAGALRQRDFWLLMASFFVCGFHVVFYATHLPAFVADQGLGNGVAVVALMAVGLGNLVGTWLAGRWGRSRLLKHGLAFIYLGRSVVFLGFLVVPPTAAFIVVASLALGLLWLATVPLTSTLVAAAHGPRWMTMLYGLVFLAHQAGSFLGAWAGGVAFDRLGSYDAMWQVSVALGLLAGGLALAIDERPARR